jgi:hypothetical protein
MAFSDNRGLAVHEAAHAVVGNKEGGKVKYVDIGNGPEKERKCNTTWPFDPGTLKHIDWLEHSEANPARAAVRRMVTCFVAGEVAEKEVHPIQTLSERITDLRFAAETDQPLSKFDLDMAVWLLNMAGIGNMDEIHDAEQRAKTVIDANTAQMGELVEMLLKDGYVEGEPLKKVLEK